MVEDDFSEVDPRLRNVERGPITPEDKGKRVRFFERLGNQWMTVLKVLSGREYPELCRDPEVEFVGDGKNALEDEYFLAKDAAGKRYIWGCNDDWQKGIPT
jgi:hypothetical protein